MSAILSLEDHANGEMDRGTEEEEKEGKRKEES
jgi:hypothetical protein